MKIDKNILILAAIIGVVLIASSFLQSGEKKTITMDGTYSETADPDKVEVTFSIVTRASSAEIAQENNGIVSDDVIAALKSMGYSENDFSTVYYNVYPEYDWSSGSQRITGYSATHQMKVNDSDISKAGSIIDAVIDKGVNQIDYVDFAIDPVKENEIRTLALSKASENARSKAEAVASGLGSRIVGVVSVNEGNVYYPPYRLDYATASAESKDVQITPGTIDISASVSVTFEIA